MYTMPIDELNTFKESLVTAYAEGRKPDKKKIISDVEDILILAYLMGSKEAAYILGDEDEVDEDQMMDSVYAKVGGNAPTPERPRWSRSTPIPGVPREQTESAEELIIEESSEDRTPMNFAERLEERDTVEEIMRVAETEAHRVFNDGEMDFAVGHGAKTKTWVTVGDDRVREEHQPLDMVTVPIDEYFVTWDGARAMRPGAFGIPELDINCRCQLSFGR